jgi:hypothetical protein
MAAPPADGAAARPVLVAVRLRPLGAGEAPDTDLRVAPDGAAATLHLSRALAGGEGALRFDHVFGPRDGNAEVYARVAAPVVAGVLAGVHGAVAAYGQTGSGKTRTMRGTPEDAGLVQRAVRRTRTRGARGAGAGARARLQGTRAGAGAARPQRARSLRAPAPRVAPRPARSALPHPRAINAAAVSRKPRARTPPVSASMPRASPRSCATFSRSPRRSPRARCACRWRTWSATTRRCAACSRARKWTSRKGRTARSSCAARAPCASRKPRCGARAAARSAARGADARAPRQALRLLAHGDARRATAATGVHAGSSRSHAIVRITVESAVGAPHAAAGDNADDDGDSDAPFVPTRRAVLSLVDLAGSETAKKTGATRGARAAEGACINKSLLVLGRVIEARSGVPSSVGATSSPSSAGSPPAAAAKPPFRDSKLTRLLKPALEEGAACATALVCTVHPAAAHATETRSTLQFARRAGGVLTRPAPAPVPPARGGGGEAERLRADALAAENSALRSALADALAATTPENKPGPPAAMPQVDNSARALARLAAQLAEADAAAAAALCVLQRHALLRERCAAEAAATQAAAAAAADAVQQHDAAAPPLSSLAQEAAALQALLLRSCPAPSVAKQYADEREERAASRDIAEAPAEEAAY